MHRNVVELPGMSSRTDCMAQPYGLGTSMHSHPIQSLASQGSTPNHAKTTKRAAAPVSGWDCARANLQLPEF